MRRRQKGTLESVARLLKGVYPAPDTEAEPGQFEQAGASDEEVRKAYPWQVPPIRPTRTFRLDQGLAKEPPALPGGDQTALPESTAGEF